MGKLQAVVFDIDGTLFDTFEYVVQAFVRVMEENGVVGDREVIVAVVGKTLTECYEILLPGVDATVAAERHHAVQQEPNMLELIKTYDGLRETLDSLQFNGIHTAVFTNRWRQGLDILLERTGLEKEFQAIVTPETVKKGKPDPEGIRLIAKELDVSEESMVMIGDTTIDIETGKNAGVLATIAVTHGFGSREQLTAAGADYVIDSLSELSGVLDAT